MAQKKATAVVAGLVLGLAMSAAIALLLSLMFHFRWRLNPNFNFGLLMLGLWLNIWSASAEELIYRGYAFSPHWICKCSTGMVNKDIRATAAAGKVNSRPKSA
jgi:membrane protease YdiL (CAAX protease family)